MNYFYVAAKKLSGALGPQSQIVRFSRPIADSILRLTTLGRGIHWEINGVRCRIDPRFRIGTSKDYDAPVAQYLRQRIRPGQIALDIGANIGVWVVQLAAMVGAGGRVFAFEPNPRSREMLSFHIRLNHLDSFTQVVPAAVGSMNGEAVLFAANTDGMSRIGEPNPLLSKIAKPITVQVVTLDHWCRENAVQPDWLFVDVEGFEEHVLAGGIQLIQARHRALGIIIEMHPSLWSSSQSSRQSMEARIRDLRLRAVPLTGQSDVFADYGHVALEPI